MTRPLQLDDVLSHRIPSELQLSVDGGIVLWTEQQVVEGKTRQQLWWVQAGGAPRQLTSGKTSACGAQFDPTGRGLCFFRTDPDRSRFTALCWLPLDGGEARVVIEVEGECSGISWSPDGQALAMTQRLHDPLIEGRDSPLSIAVRGLPYKLDGEGYLPVDRHHIVRIAPFADTPEIVPLTSGSEDDVQPQWSPDGAWVAFCSNRRGDLDPENLDVFVVPADGGESVQRTSHRGLTFSFAWSPDSTWIAAIRALGPVGASLYTHGPLLYRLDPVGGDEVCLTPGLDKDVADLTLDDVWGLGFDTGPTVLADGSVIVPLTEDGSTSLQRWTRDHGLRPLYTDRVVRGYAAAGGQLAVITTTLHTPGRIECGDLDGPLETVAWPMRPWLDEVVLRPAQEIGFRHPEGHYIQGWLILPEGPGPHPMLLHIHGGPVVAFGRGYFHENQLLAARGYAVLAVNPRGSRGYGDAFAGVVKEDWGIKPGSDLVAAVDHVLGSDAPLDGSRVGVLGGSYGGYMTNWLLAHTDRFQVGCTQRTVSHLEGMMWSDFGIGIPEELGGDPATEIARYRDMSPLYFVHQMTAPLMILQGMEDHRTPRDQGERLYIALRRLKHDVEMVLFPGASHGLSRGGDPAQRVERLRVIVDWFDRKL